MPNEVDEQMLISVDDKDLEASAKKQKRNIKFYPTHPEKAVTPEECVQNKSEINSAILSSIADTTNNIGKKIIVVDVEKKESRKDLIELFNKILVATVFMTLLFVTLEVFALILPVRIEVYIGLLLAIVVEVIGIITLFVSYITNNEHYDTYTKIMTKLLDYLIADKLPNTNNESEDFTNEK